MSCQFVRTFSAKCSTCHLKKVCIPTQLLDAEVEYLESVVRHRIVLKKEERLSRCGEQFSAIYVVNSGSFKEQIEDEYGMQKITNFFLPGEIIGLNSIGVKNYYSSTIALETASVCQINFEQLESIMRFIPKLRNEMLSLMSKEIRQEQSTIGVISHGDAKHRIVAFLLNLSTRYRLQGLSSKAFHLSMKRSEIGNYLGLATETVSRQLSLLADQKLIKVHDRHIEILNWDSIAELCLS